MSEIKNAGQTWMAKCKQLIPLPFKGLKVDGIYNGKSCMASHAKSTKLEAIIFINCRAVDVQDS